MGSDMNPEIRARWVAALRSGKYEQGTGRLYDGQKMCCLGMLCDVLKDELGLQWAEERKRELSIDNSRINLPRSIADHAGLDDCSGRLPDGRTLVYLNDMERYSFEQIADVIEREL